VATLVVIALTRGLLLGGLLLLAAVIVWLGARRRVVFRIRIEEGKVQRVAGDAPHAFVEEVERLCRFWGIDRGWIKGIRRGRRIAVTTGGGMGREHAQAFRNAWNYPVR
jgi:hypothetical protein